MHIFLTFLTTDGHDSNLFYIELSHTFHFSLFFYYCSLLLFSPFAFTRLKIKQLQHPFITTNIALNPTFNMYLIHHVGLENLAYILFFSLLILF